MSEVLIVEDNRVIRTLYASGLAGYGYHVAQAQNLDEARSYLESGGAPDVVLLDLKLPDGYGGEVIEQIRQTHPQAKIIVATGLLLKPTELAALDADAYLTKPVQLTSVLKTVDNFIN
jgi:two-component system, NtrC family, response regulator PilR